MSSEQLNSSDETTEDEKVSTDELQEKIAEFDDYVQSTDIAAMQSTSSGLQCLNPD
jgi:translation elongation factor EF-1beta